MIIKCSNCGARYRIGDDLVANGPKRFKCKSCETVLLVKPPEAAKTPVGEEPPTPPSPQTPQPSQEQPVPTADQSAQETPETDDTGQTGDNNTDSLSAGEKSGTEDSEQNDSEQQNENGDLSPEEIAAAQQQSIQDKLEERRRLMEDEISGRLNKAALETLDFDVLSELANQIQEIQHNHDFELEKDSKLFSCIKCKTTYCLFPDDSRMCANCPGEVSLVRADDILKQFGMFG